MWPTPRGRESVIASRAGSTKGVISGLTQPIYLSDLPHIFDHGVTEEEVCQVLSQMGEELPGRDG
jgi:hypothetical protein